jgi:hypothetical protein
MTSLQCPSRLGTGAVGLAIGLSSYVLAFVYTYGGMSKGIDGGSRLQQLVSALISGPAVLCMRVCDNVHLGAAGELIWMAVYLLTAALWVLLWVRLALWVRTSMLKQSPCEGSNGSR